MKRFIFSGFSLCLCCALVFCVSKFYANFEEFAITDPIEIAVAETSLSNISKVRYQGESLFVVDNTDKKIYRANGNTTICYDDVAAPFDIVALEDNEMLVSTQNVFVEHINSTGTMTEINQFTDQNGDPVGLPSPQTFGTSANFDTYLICGNDILIYDHKTKTLSSFATLQNDGSEILFDNGGFCVTENNEYLYFTTATEIFRLATADKSITKIASTTTLTNIKYIKVDNLGNLFVWDNDTLIKISGDTVVNFGDT